MACSLCHDLERDYDVAIREINSILERRFNTVTEKLQELFRWQDLRDKALQAFYEHQVSHGIGPQDGISTA